MKTSHHDEVTNEEILRAVNDFAQNVQEQFDHVQDQFGHIDERFKRVDEQFKGVHEELHGINNRLTKVEGRLTKVESTMVTKDYLDEKLFDLKGDLVVLVRKEDAKMTKLVDILQQHHVISEQEVKQILDSGPLTRIA